MSWVNVEDIPPKNWKPNTKQLYSAASYSGWTHEGIHNLIGYHFKKKSTKDLTFIEYNLVLRWIDEIQPNTIEVGKDEKELPF